MEGLYQNARCGLGRLSTVVSVSIVKAMWNRNDCDIVRAMLPSVVASDTGVIAPFDWAAYPQVWKKREWSVDRRHIHWMFDILVSGKIRTALEIGCLHGATSAAFVEALNRGTLEHATFCDVVIEPALRKTLSRCADQGKIRIFEGRSVDLLDGGGSYDLVFIDGDHHLEAVEEELERVLRLQPLCIFAHDTSALGVGYPECEGPAYLKHRLQSLGWLCLEDSLSRRGENTRRGMFFATIDQDMYAVARESFAARCDVVSIQQVSPPPKQARPTAWREVLRDTFHVARCKWDKGWLW
jgi:hypothetical protein